MSDDELESGSGELGETEKTLLNALGMFGGNSVSTSVIFSAFAGLGAVFTAIIQSSSVMTSIALAMVDRSG
jgi:Na+/phosphate symporter